MKKTTERLLRISPHQLRAFESTARLLSVTRAAKEMHVSQPTVSVQLRDLSAAIGEPLFEVVGRQIRITPSGDELLKTLAEVTDCWQRFESRLADMHGLVRGRLRIAAVTTAEYFVPDLLGPFAQAHPGVDITLAVENRDRVVERIQRGSDDLAVMMFPPRGIPLEVVPFLDNPLVVVAAAPHPLSGSRVPLRKLSTLRWLMREEGSGTRMAAEQHFARVGFVPQIAMNLGSNEAIKHAVAAGLGIAVLSRLAVVNELAKPRGGGVPRLTELQVTGFPLRRSWCVVWRQDHPLSAAAKQFITYLRRGTGGTGGRGSARPSSGLPSQA